MSFWGGGGIQGATGRQGPPGPSSSVFSYLADTNSTDATEPQPGRIRWNAASQIAATSLYIDDSSTDELDVSVFFSLKTPADPLRRRRADKIIIQDLHPQTAPVTQGQIQNRAQEIWQQRQEQGIAGTSESDWAQATSELQAEATTINRQVWELAAPIVLLSGWMQVPVRFVESSGAGSFTHDQPIAVILA